MTDLLGRVALVTGASAGLGFAAARSLGRRGARLAINSRGGEKLEAAVRTLSGEGMEVVGIAADVRDPDRLRGLTAETEKRLGPIDILIANAGGPHAKSASDLTDEDWEQAIPLALLFVPRLCRLVLPGMRRRKWGRIVAINSVASRQPIPRLALSNALRPAVLGYLKTLSAEVAQSGVTVNAVLPGYTKTERQLEIAKQVAERTGKTVEEVMQTQMPDAPIGRLADPREIGEVIGFLASTAASFITGQAVTVDGGYVKSLF